MKVLAHVILHQLLFAVWLLAMWVLYCTPPVLGPTLHPMGGRTRAMKDLGGSSHIAAWTWFVMRGHAGTARASRKRR